MLMVWIFDLTFVKIVFQNFLFNVPYALISLKVNVAKRHYKIKSMGDNYIFVPPNLKSGGERSPHPPQDSCPWCC